MPIDFSSLGANANVVPTEAVVSSTHVTVPLQKNTVLDLNKVAPSLENLALGAGWDIASIGSDYDLDISAFLLGANNKISSASDVIYFNNMSAPGIHLNGDNRTGAGAGDDEVISVNLKQVAPNVEKILLAVTIYDAVNRRQTFGQVNNSYIRLIDKNENKEIARFDLKDNYSTETAVIFGELVRNGSNWAFHSIGDGHQVDLNGLLAYFS